MFLDVYELICCKTCFNEENLNYLYSIWWLGTTSVSLGGYGLKDPDFETSQGKRLFSSARHAVGPSQSPVQWVPGFIPEVR
jgi:hypothetical protein